MVSSFTLIPYTDVPNLLSFHEETEKRAKHCSHFFLSECYKKFVPIFYLWHADKIVLPLYFLSHSWFFLTVRHKMKDKSTGQSAAALFLNPTKFPIQGSLEQVITSRAGAKYGVFMAAKFLAGLKERAKDTTFNNHRRIRLVAKKCGDSSISR